jgi:hypothetical protein
VTKTTIAWLIAEQLQKPSGKKAPYEAKSVTGKSYLAFLLEEIHAIKWQLKPPKTANCKMRKVESLLSLRKLI